MQEFTFQSSEEMFSKIGEVQKGIITFTNKETCPLCPEQIKENEIFERDGGDWKIYVIDVSTSAINKDLSKKFGLIAYPSSLFVNAGKIIETNDRIGEKSVRYFLTGLITAKKMKRVTKVIEKFEKPFDLILRENCRACVFKPLCLFRIITKRDSCRIFTRKGQFKAT